MPNNGETNELDVHDILAIDVAFGSGSRVTPICYEVVAFGTCSLKLKTLEHCIVDFCNDSVMHISNSCNKTVTNLYHMRRMSDRYASVRSSIAM